MLEAEVPGGPGGLPHFYAVGTYQLQHPTSLRAEAAIQLWATVEEALAGKVQIPDILARMRRRFGGATTVRPKDGETSDTLGTWPQSWQMTVADICATDPRYYIEMVERWASTTVATIREGRRS